MTTTTDTGTTDLRQLAADTAAHLGPDWATAPAEWPHMQSLTHSDGRVIKLNTDLYASGPARVHVAGQYPQPNSLRTSECPEISVRADRGARVLATEITRRFLLAHSKAHAQAAEYAAKDEREVQARAALNRKLAAILTGSRMITGGRHGDDDVRVEIPGAYRCSFRSDRAGRTASIELHSIPASVALAVAGAVDASARAHRRAMAERN